VISNDLTKIREALWPQPASSSAAVSGICWHVEPSATSRAKCRARRFKTAFEEFAVGCILVLGVQSRSCEESPRNFPSRPLTVNQCPLPWAWCTLSCRTQRWILPDRAGSGSGRFNALAGRVGQPLGECQDRERPLNAIRLQSRHGDDSWSLFGAETMV